MYEFHGKWVPYGFFREHVLRLLLPERMQIPTMAIVDGKACEVLGLENPTQPRQERVIETA